MNNSEWNVNIAEFYILDRFAEFGSDLKIYSIAKAVVLSDTHQLITGLVIYHSWFIKVLGMFSDLKNRDIILL